jgi:hypothetical protein
MSAKTFKSTLLPLTILLMFGVNACINSEKKKFIDSAFKQSLIEQKVKGTNYTIQLPDTYQIKERRGVDFSVYYFTPKDTTDNTAFRGGFYLGNHGAGFEANNAGCKTKGISGTILNADERWSLYDCDGKYSIETLIDSKSGLDWGRMLHAFGRANSNNDLKKLLEVYSTLKTTSE